MSDNNPSRKKTEWTTTFIHLMEYQIKA